MILYAKPKILVLGGGFGGLETAFYLRMKLADQADISLISDKEYFLFKPNTIYIPFGLDPEKLLIRLDRPMKEKNITFIHGTAHEIDPVNKLVMTHNHEWSYDYLVVATGAGMRPAEIPGLTEYAQMIWSPQDMLELREALHRLVMAVDSGRSQRLLFLVPPNNKCSGPLYEMVLMLDTWLRRNGRRAKVNITWSTYEGGYIQAFGPRLDEVVTGEFERRQVTGHKQYVVEKVEKGAVVYKNGQSLPYDLLISFPPYIAANPFPGLPSDERGFLKTVLETRQVLEHPDIYAVGDAGDFPVKQAFLAFLQADAAAEHLAATIKGIEPEVAFDPVSMCVMEQFDKATFAQVPLRLTGNPERPIEVRSDTPELYKVGSSATWRLGKKLLGVYLPWRFNAGEPFHAGLPWKGMEVGLKVMATLLAD